MASGSQSYHLRRCDRHADERHVEIRALVHLCSTRQEQEDEGKEFDVETFEGAEEDSDKAR